MTLIYIFGEKLASFPEIITVIKDVIKRWNNPTVRRTHSKSREIYREKLIFFILVTPVIALGATLVLLRLTAIARSIAYRSARAAS